MERERFLQVMNVLFLVTTASLPIGREILKMVSASRSLASKFQSFAGKKPMIARTGASAHNGKLAKTAADN